jgi:MFS family permease
MHSAFRSPGAKTRYLAVTVATFLLFTTGACLSYLSKVLATVGFDPGQTGLMVASGSIPVVLCSLLAGRLLERLSARAVVAMGMAMVAAGYASLGWTARTGLVAGPSLSLAVMIGGMGLYMPAAFLLVRSCVVPERLMQFVGIYGAMQLLPSVFGPMWAQAVFQSHGLGAYFLITALPAVAGLGLLLAAGGEPAAAPQAAASAQATAQAAAGEGYARLLLHGKVALPCMGGLVAGGVFGAVNIFVALLLLAHGTPIHFFFVPFVLAYLLTRFLLLALLERRNRALSVGCGIGLMAAGVALLWMAGARPTATVLAAVLFGCGFSMNYPVASVWISELFPAAQRARPVALFNSLYTFGMYASPLATGLLLESGGPQAFYAFIVAIGLSATVAMVLYRRHGRLATGGMQ